MTDQSDAEIICSFMCPKPPAIQADAIRWWYLEQELGPGWGQWHPRTLDLDALWKVEQKMLITIDNTGRQLQIVYGRLASNTWHLTAAQKVEGLALVIRGLK